MKKPKYLKWALIFLVIGLIMLNPVTRQVVLWVLPLGSGLDDVIAVATLILAAVFFVYHKLQRRKES